MTDIVESSTLWEQDRAGAAMAIRQHDHVIHDGVTRRDGYVFAAGGDSFAVAFEAPSAAAETALAIRNRLALLKPIPLVVRQALHTGVAVERDGGYYGPPLNRCARLLDLIDPDEIAVSDVTAGLLAATSSFGFETIGVLDLRGLQRPERVSVLSDRPG